MWPEHACSYVGLGLDSSFDAVPKATLGSVSGRPWFGAAASFSPSANRPYRHANRARSLLLGATWLFLNSSLHSSFYAVPKAMLGPACQRSPPAPFKPPARVFRCGGAD